MYRAILSATCDTRRGLGLRLFSLVFFLWGVMVASLVSLFRDGLRSWSGGPGCLLSGPHICTEDSHGRRGHAVDVLELWQEQWWVVYKSFGRPRQGCQPATALPPRNPTAGGEANPATEMLSPRMRLMIQSIESDERACHMLQPPPAAPWKPHKRQYICPAPLQSWSSCPAQALQSKPHRPR